MISGLERYVDHGCAASFLHGTGGFETGGCLRIELGFSGGFFPCR